MQRFAICTLLALALCCAACSKPEKPGDDPPDPQAQASAAATAEQDTELRDAIQAPIEKAKAVEGQLQEAADKQQAEIEAQGG